MTQLRDSPAVKSMCLEMPFFSDLLVIPEKKPSAVKKIY